MQLLLLLTVLTCSTIVDFSWIIYILSQWFSFIDVRPVFFIVRLAWVANYILFLTLGFFVESLIQKDFKLKIRQKLFILFSSPWILYFVYVAFFQYNFTQVADREVELIIMHTSIIFLYFILVIPSVYVVIRELHRQHFPKILKKQLIILNKFFIAPYLFTQIMDILSVYYMQPYIIIGISNAFIAAGVYFSITRIMKLRFLNFETKVQPPENIEFIDNFKTFLSTITNTKSLAEVTLLVKNFFQETFHINTNRVTICYRNSAFYLPQSVTYDPPVLSTCEIAFEKLVNNPVKHEQLLTIMKQQQILIYDEIEFSNFYKEETIHQEILSFMKEMKADIFLPIYEHHNLIAFLIINNKKEHNELFNNLEYSQMVIVGKYLGHIITMLQLSNYRGLIAQNKLLQEQLYEAHRENNNYKETIQLFLKDMHNRHIGVITYDSTRFAFINQSAKELIGINPNMHSNHPISKQLKQLVAITQEYESSQTITIDTAAGKKLVASALLHSDKKSIIIIICHAEIAEQFKQEVAKLGNPATWEYLLYLQTTESGKLINKLIPGNSKNLLNFKIDLLKAALSKRPIVLDIPEDDLEGIIEILHHSSLRDHLYKLTMSSPEKNNSIAIKLCGVNPLFGSAEQSLLEQLNGSGTLFIQNIHLLELSTQDALAEFIRYGYYTVQKSNKKLFADVRLIFSTTQNLHQLVHEGAFSKILYQELEKNILTMPSLFQLSDDELHELVKDFIKQENLANEIEFTKKDKERLIEIRSLSIANLKKKIRNVIIEKSKKHDVYYPAHNDDSDLIEANLLGKNLLRDKEKFIKLMQKFDYNQKKVAAFLGVNHSSVSRRIKAYNLEIGTSNNSTSEVN